jgi:hypothetical protein
MKLSSGELKTTPEGRSTVCDILIVNDDPMALAGQNEEVIAYLIRNVDYISPTLDIRVYTANPANFATTIEVKRKLFPWQSERQSTVIAGARVLIEFDFKANNRQKARGRIELARRANVEVLIEAREGLDDLAKEFRIPSFACGNGLLALLEHRLGRKRCFSFIGEPNLEATPASGKVRLNNLRDGLILALVNNDSADLFMPFFEVYAREYLRSGRQLVVVGTLEPSFHSELSTELLRIGFPDVLLFGSASDSEFKKLHERAFGIVVLGNTANLHSITHHHKNLQLIPTSLQEPERNSKYQQVFAYNASAATE